VDYNALTKTATFNPSGSLNYNTLYSAVVSKGVKDNEGVNLLIDFNFSFETRIFEDNFDRSNGAPGNNWNTYSDGSTYQNAIDFNYMAQSASGAGTAQLARYLESYTSTKFPLRIKSRLYVDGTSTYGWSYINYGAINNLDWPGEGNFIQIRIEWSGYQYKAVISNTSSYIQSVNIGFTTKQWYLLKIEFFPSFVRLKLWPESEMEPTLWTVQLDRAVWDLGGEYLILGQRNGNPNYYHSLWDDLVIQDLN
jgi:hypothetical protein